MGRPRKYEQGWRDGPSAGELMDEARSALAQLVATVEVLRVDQPAAARSFASEGVRALFKVAGP